MFEHVNQNLSEQGLRFQAEKILDTTIIHAHSSTNNNQGELDFEMYSVAKGNYCFFGCVATTVLTSTLAYSIPW
jgi:hypothetical protein